VPWWFKRRRLATQQYVCYGKTVRGHRYKVKGKRSAKIGGMGNNIVIYILPEKARYL